MGEAGTDFTLNDTFKMLGELPYFEAFTSAKDDMETSLKNKKSYEPSENQPLNEYRALKALGAYRCHLNGGDGEANLTTFFTRRLHEIESKAEQYKKSRGNKKRELKEYSP